MSTFELWQLVQLKGALLIGATVFTAAVIRRQSAAIRHLGWIFGFVAALIVPIGTTLLPRWNIEIPKTLTSRVTPPPGAPSSPNTAPDFQSAPSSTTQPAPDSARPSNPVRQVVDPAAELPWMTAVTDRDPVEPEPKGSWQNFALIIWAIGAVAVVAWVLVGSIGVTIAMRRAEPVQSEGWRETIGSVGYREPGRRRIEYRETGLTDVPYTWGFLRPVVLLPRSGAGWSTSYRRNALIHELAHLERHDAAGHLVVRLACAVYWLNPVIWIAARLARLAREQACDDAVLASGGRPSEYASQLLTTANLSNPTPAFSAALPMIRRSQVVSRLLAVLDPDRSRRSPSPTVRTVWLAMGLALGAPIGAMTVGTSQARLDATGVGVLERLITAARKTLSAGPETGGPSADTEIAGPRADTTGDPNPDQQQARVTRRDSAGIEIVSSSGPTLGRLAIRLASRPTLRLVFDNDTVDSRGYTYSQHAYAAVRLENGKLVVWAEKLAQHRLEWYATDGTRLEQYPGENQSWPAWCNLNGMPSGVWTNGDSLTVLVGYRDQYLASFDPSGRLLRCASLDLTSPDMPELWGGSLPPGQVNGGMVSQFTVPHPGMSRNAPLGTRRVDTMAFVFFRENGSFGRVIAKVPGWTSELVKQGDDRFAEGVVFEGFGAFAAMGDRIYVTSGRRPEVVGYDTAGKIRTIIRWEEARRAVTPEMRVAYKAEFERPRDYPTVFADSLGYAYHIRPIIGGGLLIPEMNTYLGGTTVRVFDRTGAWLTTIELKAGTEILDIGQDYVVVRSYQPGKTYVELYALEKRTP